jgi:hypothetical protein
MAMNFRKFKIFNFLRYRNKLESIDPKNWVFLRLTQKIVSKRVGSGISDPGYEKNLFHIPDPDTGVKKAADPRSRIRILNTAKYL